MKTEKIQLPGAGQSTRVNLPTNFAGARSLQIANWNGVRYYITYCYKTKFNQKTRDAGWIACDGSDWEGLYLGDEDMAEVIRSLYPMIGGEIAK